MSLFTGKKRIKVFIFVPLQSAPNMARQLQSMDRLFIPPIPLGEISLAAYYLEAALWSVICYRAPPSCAYHTLMCRIKFIELGFALNWLKMSVWCTTPSPFPSKWMGMQRVGVVWALKLDFRKRNMRMYFLMSTAGVSQSTLCEQQWKTVWEGRACNVCVVWVFMWQACLYLYDCVCVCVWQYKLESVCVAWVIVCAFLLYAVYDVFLFERICDDILQLLK